jgi:hypothetical protein
VSPSGDRAGTNDRRSSKAGPSNSDPIQVNEVFAAAAPNGCQYSATVRGTVRPVRTGAAEEPKYAPNLLVNAWVSCRSKTELRVIDNPLRETTVGRADLEQTLALRGTLLAGSATKRCAYVPELSMGDNRLVVQSVSYLCPVHAGTGAVAELRETAQDPTRDGLASTGAEVFEGNAASDERTPGDPRMPKEGRIPLETRLPDGLVPTDYRAPRSGEPRAAVEATLPRNKDGTKPDGGKTAGAGKPDASRPDGNKSGDTKLAPDVHVP